MSTNTKIEWTDVTWNPIRGCSRVSEGCRNCYAEKTAARFSFKGGPYEGLARIENVQRPDGTTLTAKPHWTGEVRFVEERLADPLHWRPFPDRAKRIFVNSMSDLFHEKVPIEWIARIFNVMASATTDCGKKHKHEPECWCGDSHTYQVLTKRPERMREIIEQLPEYCSEHFDSDSPMNLIYETKNGWPLPNVWLGVSVEDQKTADERIPLLVQTPAAVRWVSYEPALGPVDFTRMEIMGHSLDALRGEWCSNHSSCLVDDKGDGSLNWIVAGGESGPGARPAHPDWFRAVRDQCAAAGVAFFLKQWGEWAPLDVAGDNRACDWKPIGEKDALTRIHKFDDENGLLFRIGKKAAGRLLDGREWDEYPGVTATADPSLRS